VNTIGVDPGLKGAIACLFEDGLVAVADMPTLRVIRNKKTKLEIDIIELCVIFQSFGIAEAIVERPHAMPGQGVVSAFALGKACGIVDGALTAMMIPVSHVAPATWKRDMGLSADKSESRRLASQLYPSSSGLWKRVKDDGRAEAVLLAHYLRNVM